MKIPAALHIWILSLSLFSCRNFQPQELLPDLTKDEQDVTITDVQLRTQLLEYAANFSGIVQHAADEIVRLSTDPAVKRQAVEWKIRTIPLCRQIVLDKEPRDAFLDLWALSWQLELHYKAGAAAQQFEENEELLFTACSELIAGIESIASSILPPEAFESARSEIRRFAEEHPITGSLARQSQLPSGSKGQFGVSFDWVGSIPIIGAFDGLDEGAKAVREVAEVGERFSRIAAALPEETRWQTELLLYDLESRDTIVELREALEATSDGVNSFAQTAAGLPEEIGSVLQDSFAELESQRSGWDGTLAESRLVLADVDDVLVRGVGLAGSFERTAESLARASMALEDMALAFMGPPQDPGESETQSTSNDEDGFDVEAYGISANRIGQGAAELRALVSDLRGAAGSDELENLLAGTGSRVEELVDRLVLGALSVLAAALAAALGYRFITLRWMPARVS